MKKLYFLFALLLSALLSQAQIFTFSGQVRDYETGETLIGANVLVKQGLGTITTPDGNFSIQLTKGKYSVVVSYVGFDPVKFELNLEKDVYKLFNLKPQMIGEISVVSDVARERETPVAFSTIKPAKIEEELAARDLPLVLNSTPGVYATQQGGGDGDARVNIRGFNQSNLAIMLDGVPVNDMENGWVYWSNWFGLDLVTRSMQVQRGLSASKLTIPSVGGTMNIITKGIETNRETRFKQEIDGDGKSRSSLSFTSGKLKNGWGFTLAGSYKGGDGYVDETWTKAWFYYAKIDKRVGNHIISFSAMGAPQEHGQRYYKRAIATYDSAYAVSLGVDIFPTYTNLGDKYNQNWGYLERWTGSIIDTIFHPAMPNVATKFIYDTTHVEKERLHYKYNQYHKPMFNLRDFWTINDKLYVSNILYLSLGQGGGSSTASSLNDSNLDEFGQINWQNIYNNNRTVNNIDATYSETLFKAGNYRVMNVNEHIWYGLLSTANYKQNNNLTWSGGIDLRSYKGNHYQKIIDLLGADYAIDIDDANQESPVKKVGDKIYFHDNAWVNWAGLFGQVEYTSGCWSLFGNLSAAETGYKKIDLFKLPTDSLRESGWLYKTSLTIKGGANYNINEQSNLFMNTGFLSKARSSNNIYNGYLAKFRTNTENEKIYAFELGYSFHNPIFAFNLNAYYTYWNGKPMNNMYFKDDEGDDLVGYINGINELHQGIELDFIYKIHPKLQFQGLVSIGDWTYQSIADSVACYNADNQTQFVKYASFNATGIHVGDAAQTQFMGQLRFEPIKNLYISAQYIYFDRYYADFTPTLMDESSSISSSTDPIDSWKIPAYGLMDLNMGYGFKVQKSRIDIRFSMTNVLNTLYISDATNNDQYIYSTFPTDRGYEASTSSVFLGLGRRFNTSVSISF
ncbi:MAG: TonB-dependent receptor [Bacteroidales bacterium]|nr:TonB-dependent receptor [Bacteroidales bacterium]